jgi:hypothetical protein
LRHHSDTAPILTGWLKQTTGAYAAPMLANFSLLLLGIGRVGGFRVAPCPSDLNVNTPFFH